jgi:hypothetical protein
MRGTRVPRTFKACRLALLVGLLAGCGHRGGNDSDSGPRTNIDLTVTQFSVSPSSSDTEDVLHLTGTVQNIGSETANPMQGDSFLLRFNLSTDGTFEFREEGFFQKLITDPIPPGGSFDFAYDAPYGDGETLSVFGNFCNSNDCLPPETGVIGVKVDGADVINEVDEKNNFQFVTHEVIGTRVAVVHQGCDDALCDLTISDGLYTTVLHRPCSGQGCPPARELVLPNELHRTISASLTIRNCQNSTVPGGSCGGAWIIESETQKLPLVNKKQFLLSCLATYPGTTAVCGKLLEIRDESF